MTIDAPLTAAVGSDLEIVYDIGEVDQVGVDLVIDNEIQPAQRDLGGVSEWRFVISEETRRVRATVGTSLTIDAPIAATVSTDLVIDAPIASPESSVLALVWSVRTAAPISLRLDAGIMDSYDTNREILRADLDEDLALEHVA